jgi:tetratricopeptide (TPR) repeat protein
LEQFEAGLQINPDDVRLLYQKGLALRALGRMKEATEAFRSAAELNPEHAETRTYLVEALYRTGRRDDVLRLTAALEAQKELAPLARFCRGAVRLDQGDASAAVDDLAAVVRSMPEFTLAYVRLAEALLALEGEHERSAWLLEETKKRDRALPETLIKGLERKVKTDG